MKSLLKFAVGAAIAGALVNMLMKQRSASNKQPFIDDLPLDPGGAGEAMPTELVADSSSVGEGSGDDRVQLPDDGRVGQPTLNS